MDFLQIGGQSLPISFGYGALMEYEQATGKSVMALLEGGAEMKLTDIFTLIACGLTNGADAANEPKEYTAKAVSRLLDDTENSPAVLAKAMELLQKSFAVVEQKKTVPLHANRETRRKAKTA